MGGAVEWATGQPECVPPQLSNSFGGVFLQPGPSRNRSFLWTGWVNPPSSEAAQLGRGRGKPWLLIGRMTHLPGIAGIQNRRSYLGAILVFRGHLAMCGDLFGCPTWSGMVLLASRRQKFNSIPQCTRKPFTIRNYSAQKVTSAKVEKPRGWGQGCEFPWVTLSPFTPTAHCWVPKWSPVSSDNYSLVHGGCDGSHLGIRINFGLFWTILWSSKPSLWLGVESRPGTSEHSVVAPEDELASLRLSFVRGQGAGKAGKNTGFWLAHVDPLWLYIFPFYLISLNKNYIPMFQI